MASPVYGQNAPAPVGNGWVYRARYQMILPSDVVVPSKMSTVKIKEKAVLAEYEKAWADYIAAYKEISSMFQSYTSREKFEEDFPGFVKYLPAVLGKRSLPMVVVSNIKQNLAAAGVMV